MFKNPRIWIKRQNPLYSGMPSFGGQILSFSGWVAWNPMEPAGNPPPNPPSCPTRRHHKFHRSSFQPRENHGESVAKTKVQIPKKFDVHTGGFLKWWVSPATMGLNLLKMIMTWGVKWGVPPFFDGLMVQKSGEKTSWYGSLSHYLQGFLHPRWCRISERMKGFDPFFIVKFSSSEHVHACYITTPILGILAHLLRMVMEPKYIVEDVIVHQNHPLTRWLDPYCIYLYC